MATLLPDGSSTSDDVDSSCPRFIRGRTLRWEDLEFGDCISNGELTTVHRGVLHTGGFRRVVIKALHHKACMHDPQALAELLAEIRMTADLSHPHIVSFVGACLEPHKMALVTDLAPGGNLHHALHVRHRRYSRAERFQLATELLEGVRYLHHLSPPIIHLDLKSLNLVLDAQEQHLRICDFGLARVMDGDGVGRPSRGGSPRYMAPECHDSTLGLLTEKADVWSSGCVLIEIFDSSMPYAECSNVQQILKMMLLHRCPPPVPERIEDRVRIAIQWALAFDAEDRTTINQVLCQLQTVAKSTEYFSKLGLGWQGRAGFAGDAKPAVCFQLPVRDARAARPGQAMAVRHGRC